MKSAIAGLLAIAIAVAAASEYASLHRRLAAERRDIDALWTELDDALQTRADRISDLAAAVKPFAPSDDPAVAAAAHAHQSLAAVLSPADKLDADQQLNSALTALLALAEKHPQPHSTPAFLRASREIAAAGDRIAVGRRKYNEAIERYNTDLTIFPNNLVARIAGFRRDDAYFQTNEESLRPAVPASDPTHASHHPRPGAKPQPQSPRRYHKVE